MKIDHIGIATREIQDAITFYRDVLGLDVTETEEVAEDREFIILRCESMTFALPWLT